MTFTAGRLLVAEPMLGDPNFDRTVVLMIEHSPAGAIGIVLNRPTDLSVAGVLPAWDRLATDPAVIHVGGPVEERSGWCLARRGGSPDERLPEGFVPVLGDIGLVDLDQDPDSVATWATAVRLYAGYSGWGPEQLEGELNDGAWFVVDAHPDDPFLPDGTALWRRILSRQAGPLSRLALFPPHPSMN